MRGYMLRRFSMLIMTFALAASAAQPADIATTLPAAAPTNQQAAATSVPATPDDLDDPARIAASAPAPRDQTALAEAFKGIGDVPDVARTTPLDVKIGDIETFWVADLATNTNYQITAKLRYAGPVELMYVDTTLETGVDQAVLEHSAKQFEQEIYPRDRALFGRESL